MLRLQIPFELKRQVTSHAVTELDKQLHIHTVDEPGLNGDNHAYLFSGPGFTAEIRDQEGVTRLRTDSLLLNFHQGNPANGFNGVTIEGLLAVCADRLEGCQSGPYASDYNAAALLRIREAIGHLHDRSLNRDALKELGE